MSLAHNQLVFIILTEQTSVWVEIGANVVCDGSAGELYLHSSPAQVFKITLEKCKNLCYDKVGCQSITYFPNSKRCSHFSTLCTRTRKKQNAQSYRKKGRAIAMSMAYSPMLIGKFGFLVLGSRALLLERTAQNPRVRFVNSQPPLILTDTARVWTEVGANIVCDVGAGELYLGKPTKTANVEQCQKLCQDAAGCHSITYFHNNGSCVHFGSLCAKTKGSDNTVSYRWSKPANTLSLGLPRSRIGESDAWGDR